MSNETTWGEAIQLDDSTGLWYKFGIRSNNRDWEIFCSGDKDSLEKGSVIYHDHYWQRDGKWYLQGKRIDIHTGRNIHTIGRDGFLEDLKIRNQEATLDLMEDERQLLGLQDSATPSLSRRQIESIANYRANLAYGTSGYRGDNHGVEVSSYDCNNTITTILNRQVQQYQELTQLTSGNLIWQNDSNPASESVLPELNWRQDMSNLSQTDKNALPSVYNSKNQNPKRNNTRRINRK